MRLEVALLARDGAPLALLLAFLADDDALALLQASPPLFLRLQRLKRRFSRSSARFSLAVWLARHVRLELLSQFQERKTATIPRSSDPRVPPHVRSYWAERGQVEGGRVLLKVSSLPIVYDDAVFLSFSGGDQATRRPMLANVPQGNRRIYTVVRLIVDMSSDEDSANDAGSSGQQLELRKYTYVKEFHEWHTLNPLEKRALDASGAPCRYDLVTVDGSIALELDVPSGADAQVDYYLIKKCVARMHLQEILQRYFSQIRPAKALPTISSDRRECSIQVTFRRHDGQQISRCSFLGMLEIDRQGERDAHNSTTAEGSRHETEEAPIQAIGQTGIEAFDIVNCSVIKPVSAAIKLELPKDPGYCFLQVRDAQSRELYFYAPALHRGAERQGHLSVLKMDWLPGVLEMYPMPESRHRRCLKGRIVISTGFGSHALEDLAIVAQRLPKSTLDRYAAAIQSYTSGNE